MTTALDVHKFCQCPGCVRARAAGFDAAKARRFPLAHVRDLAAAAVHQSIDPRDLLAPMPSVSEMIHRQVREAMRAKHRAEPCPCGCGFTCGDLYDAIDLAVRRTAGARFSGKRGRIFASDIRAEFSRILAGCATVAR